MALRVQSVKGMATVRLIGRLLEHFMPHWLLFRCMVYELYCSGSDKAIVTKLIVSGHELSKNVVQVGGTF